MTIVYSKTTHKCGCTSCGATIHVVLGNFYSASIVSPHRIVIECPLCGDRRRILSKIAWKQGAYQGKIAPCPEGVYAESIKCICGQTTTASLMHENEVLRTNMLVLKSMTRALVLEWQDSYAKTIMPVKMGELKRILMELEDD